jgi:hypothetical protein
MPLSADDPLLPMPNLEPWISDEVELDIRRVAGQVADFYSFHSLVWPARDAAGQLIPPPDEHLFDHLVHSYLLLPEDEIRDRIPADTVCVMSTLPRCDVCGGVGRYDGVIATSGGVNGYMCTGCFAVGGSGQLGTSEATYLMAADEVPEVVRDICDEICRRTARPSIWAED